VKFYYRFGKGLSILNLMLNFMKWPIRVYYLNGLVIKDSSFTLNISRLSRLYLYKNGINNRLKKMADDYHLHLVDFSDGCTVIDVGANIGELNVLLKSSHNLNYYGIEPDPIEFRSLQKNAADCNLQNVALFSSSGKMNFFSSNETGDSSLIQNVSTANISQINTIKLSEYIDSLPEGSVKLLKLEAEGVEFEILSVLEDTHFSKIEFISADLGCERGMKLESTLVPVVNLLLNKGYKIIHFNPYRLTVLFGKN
jgi:FkbM family methyltransferase